MDKIELMAKAEAALFEGLDMIDADPVHGKEQAEQYWAAQKAAYCQTDEERGWWDTGFRYGNETAERKMKGWEYQFGILNEAFKKAGLPDHLRRQMILLWNEWYVSTLDETQKA